MTNQTEPVIAKHKWYITQCVTRRHRRAVLLNHGVFTTLAAALTKTPPRADGIRYVPVRGDRILNNRHIYEIPEIAL